MTPPMAFEAASRLWRDRITRTPDYSVIRNDRIFRTSFSDSCILASEYEGVMRLKRDLCRSYQDSPLEEVFPGCTENTTEGPCYCITSRERLHLPGGDPGGVREALCSDLTLVFGIGERKARELKRKGYRTINDLLLHRRFGPSARDCLDVLLHGSPEQVTDLVSRWHSRSSHQAVRTAGLYRPEQFLFLDLETLGIYQRPIILIGLAGVEGQELVLRQYLLRTIDEELPALLAAQQYLGPDRVLVTYNGRTFDIPYLRERYAYYGEPARILQPHFDLLHPSRKRWRDLFPDCRLMTLESRLLGVTREQDVPSALVPEFYESFLTSGNPGPLVPVVMHNRQDLVSLARLFCLLREGCA